MQGTIAFGQIIDIKNMELQIKIQSFSDIVTNSSSETFILNSSENFKEISSLLKKIGEEHWYKGSWSDWDNLPKEEQEKYDTGSGMGGDIEVRNWESLYEEYKEYIPENKKDLYTPEVWSLNFPESLEELKNTLWISIDWSRKGTINWILQNLWVTDAYEGFYRREPSTGRIIEKITEEEWKKLPNDQRN